MNVLITFSMIVILLAHLESKRILKYGMLIGFIILTIAMSVRYDYGNDYMSYMTKFLYDNNYAYSISDLFNGNIKEPFWFLLNRLFKPFGFQSLVIFLTILNSIVYYNLIHKYLPSRLRVFGLFIYFFTNSIFPMQLSMMRQGLSMTLVVSSLLLILNRNRIYSILLLIIASGIHTSALVALPIVCVVNLNLLKYKKIISIVLLCLFTVFYFARDYISSIMTSLLHSISAFETYEDKYLLGTKYEASEAKSLFGTFLYLFPVFLSFIYLKFCDDERNFKFVILYLIGAFMFLTSQVIPMVDRLAWYFTIFSIIALPLSFSNIKFKIFRYGFIALFVMVTIREYYGFFHALNWKDAFLEFKTLFS